MKPGHANVSNLAKYYNQLCQELISFNFKPLFIQVHPIEIIDLFFKGDLLVNVKHTVIYTIVVPCEKLWHGHTLYEAHTLTMGSSDRLADRHPDDQPWWSSAALHSHWSSLDKRLHWWSPRGTVRASSGHWDIVLWATASEGQSDDTHAANWAS